MVEPVLQYLYENIPSSGITNGSKLKIADKEDDYKKGYFIDVDMREFYDDEVKANFKETAMLYYPPQCVGADKKCKLQVLFHGCGGNSGTMSNPKKGWTNAAYANDVIQFFPQTFGMCWDAGGLE